MRLPPAVGEHPALGFAPRREPDLPVLPASVRLRYLPLLSAGGGAWGWLRRTVPVGTPERYHALLVGERAATLELALRDGTTAAVFVHGSGSETGLAARKRARLTGGAPPRRRRDGLPEPERTETRRPAA